MLKNLAKYCLLLLVIIQCSSVELKAQCGLSFTTTFTPTVTCNGDCNSQATLSSPITGGSGNFSYLWSPGGETTQFAQNLCAGNVTFTITDITNGCDTTVTFVITEPAPVNAALTEIPSCIGQCTGSVEITATGGGGLVGSSYPLIWIGPTTNDTLLDSVDNSLTIPSLCIGNYTAILTDPLGCPDTAFITVTEPTTPLVATIPVSVNASCFGICDGSANPSVSGSLPFISSPNYLYLWDDPAAQTTANASNLCGSPSPGTAYTLTVTDSIGCFTTAMVNITQPLRITLDFTPTNLTCAGNCDGAGAITNTAGGNSPYTYAWSSGQTTTSVTNVLCANVPLSVTVTDVQGCDTTIDFTLTQPAGLEGDIAPFSDCDGAGNITATATANPTTGSGSYFYTWDDPALQTTQEAVGLTIGQTYNVVVLDSDGCRLEASTTIPIALCDLVIPNTFSPNGDGFNDTWILENMINYTKAKIKVYNRWGDIVYTSTGYDTPWDGKFAGTILPAAVYYYVIEVDELDPPGSYGGQLTIVK